MNKTSIRTAMICSGIFGVLALAELLSDGKDGGVLVGLTAIILSVVYLFLGIILAVIKDTRNAGMGMLLTSGLMLLVGFTVCSLSTFRI